MLLEGVAVFGRRGGQPRSLPRPGGIDMSAAKAPQASAIDQDGFSREACAGDLRWRCPIGCFDTHLVKFGVAGFASCSVMLALFASVGFRFWGFWFARGVLQTGRTRTPGSIASHCPYSEALSPSLRGPGLGRVLVAQVPFDPQARPDLPGQTWELLAALR